MDIGRDLKFNNYPFQQLEKNEITDLLFITVFNITLKKKTMVLHQLSFVK